ncbi:MAG: prepilin peptidase [Paenibacillaceae bacterium]
MLPVLTLSVALVISVITDLRNRKIYNLVVFPGIVVAFMFQIWFAGMSGALEALAGFAVGLGLLLIPYLLGGMGAGDVKLLAMIGAFKGTLFVLVAAAYMAVIGAVLAMLVLICAKDSINRIKLIAFLICGLKSGVIIPIDYRATFPSEANPYGVAIAGGAFCGLLFF